MSFSHLTEQKFENYVQPGSQKMLSPEKIRENIPCFKLSRKNDIIHLFIPIHILATDSKSSLLKNYPEDMEAVMTIIIIHSYPC